MIKSSSIYAIGLLLKTPKTYLIRKNIGQMVYCNKSVMIITLNGYIQTTSSIDILIKNAADFSVLSSKY